MRAILTLPAGVTRCLMLRFEAFDYMRNYVFLTRAGTAGERLRKGLRV